MPQTAEEENRSFGFFRKPTLVRMMTLPNSSPLDAGLAGDMGLTDIPGWCAFFFVANGASASLQRLATPRWPWYTSIGAASLPLDCSRGSTVRLLPIAEDAPKTIRVSVPCTGVCVEHRELCTCICSCGKFEHLVLACANNSHMYYSKRLDHRRRAKRKKVGVCHM